MLMMPRVAHKVADIDQISRRFQNARIVMRQLMSGLERQEQRLGVDRAEEERKRREGEQEDSVAGGPVA